jgi:hypothetical protein
MRLLNHLMQAGSGRRYRAALTIYLAAYTYHHLSQSDRNRISGWVRSLIDGRFNPAFSFKEYEMFLPVRTKAAFWAVAMKSLSISPAIPGEVWDIPSQPRWWNRFSVVNTLILDFRPLNPSTRKAEDYLASKGADVTAIDLQAK